MIKDNPRIADLFGDDEKIMRYTYQAALMRRWRYGNTEFFRELEAAGVLIARCVGRRRLYALKDVLTFERSHSRLCGTFAFQDRFLTATEFAELCSLRRSKVMKLVQAEQIPHLRIGSAIRFSTSDSVLVQTAALNA